MTFSFCHSYLIHLYPVYMIKLARRAGYVLAGQASSMYARCLLGVCSTFAQFCKWGINDTLF